MIPLIAQRARIRQLYLALPLASDSHDLTPVWRAQAAVIRRLSVQYTQACGPDALVTFEQDPRCHQGAAL